MRSTSMGKSSFDARLPAETLVGIGIRATQEMIQVRDAGDLETLVFGNLAQQIQQRHRVGATRKRDGHTAAGGKQSVSANGAPDGIDDAHRRVRVRWVRQVREVRQVRRCAGACDECERRTLRTYRT